MAPVQGPDASLRAAGGTGVLYMWGTFSGIS